MQCKSICWFLCGWFIGLDWVNLKMPLHKQICVVFTLVFAKLRQYILKKKQLYYTSSFVMASMVKLLLFLFKRLQSAVFQKELPVVAFTSLEQVNVEWIHFSNSDVLLSISKPSNHWLSFAINWFAISEIFISRSS